MQGELRRSFKKAAYIAAAVWGGVYAHDKLGKPGTSLYDRIEISWHDKGQCAYQAQLENPKTHEQERLSYFYHAASQSLYGASVVQNAVEDGVKFCFTDDLQDAEDDGYSTIGEYSREVVKLNSKIRHSVNRKLTQSIVHETRHHYQYENRAYVLWVRNMPNIRPEDYVAYALVGEADARLSEVLFAHEMKAQGDRSYMDGLKYNVDFSKMVRAFERSLRENPDDIEQAMKAGFMAFYEQPTANHYIFLNILEREVLDLPYDESEQAKEILTGDYLQAVGHVPGYGNYMDDELMAFVRDSFSAEDYGSNREKYDDLISKNMKEMEADAPQPQDRGIEYEINPTPF